VGHGLEEKQNSIGYSMPVAASERDPELLPAFPSRLAMPMEANGGALRLGEGSPPNSSAPARVTNGIAN
jgi:hypothetical protein